MRCRASKRDGPGNLQKFYRVNPALTMGCTMKMMMNCTLLTKRCFCTHTNRNNLCLMIFFQAICYAVSTRNANKEDHEFSLFLKINFVFENLDFFDN